MKIHRIYLYTAVFLVCSGLLACNTKSDKHDNEEGRQQLSELGKIIGAKFPPGSKIIYTESNGRNKEAYSYHIIYSPSPAKFDHPPEAKISSEGILENLKEASFTKDLEKIKNKRTYCYEGAIGKGRWNAYQTNFGTGSYLEVKQIFLYWQTGKN